MITLMFYDCTRDVAVVTNFGASWQKLAYPIFNLCTGIPTTDWRIAMLMNALTLVVTLYSGRKFDEL